MIATVFGNCRADGGQANVREMSLPEENAPRLERALTLRDLVLFNLVAVVGITWVATAAKAGPSALTLWLLAALLFFIPQGLAVIQLSSSYPDEGGIYAWTKKEFGEGHGFLCGWCYWINNVLFYPTLLLSAAVMATYVIGRGESGLADNWSYVLPFTLIALTVAVWLNVVGVGTGKWLQNIGGLSVYLPGILLVLLGLHGALTRSPANALSYGQLKPDLTNLPLLNLWATIAFAFAGLELSSTMGHEIQNPRRNLPRSIYIAAPLVAVVYICGTGSMLWLVPREEINIVAGPLQALQMECAISAAAVGGLFRWPLLLAVARVGAVGAWLTGSARVAFVVGLDRYFRGPSRGSIRGGVRLIGRSLSGAYRRFLSAVIGAGQRDVGRESLPDSARHVAPYLLYSLPLPLPLLLWFTAGGAKASQRKLARSPADRRERWSSGCVAFRSRSLP